MDVPHNWFEKHNKWPLAFLLFKISIIILKWYHLQTLKVLPFYCITSTKRVMEEISRFLSYFNNQRKRSNIKVNSNFWINQTRKFVMVLVNTLSVLRKEKLVLPSPAGSINTQSCSGKTLLQLLLIDIDS